MTEIQRKQQSGAASWVLMLKLASATWILSFLAALVDAPWFGGTGGGRLYCIGILCFYGGLVASATAATGLLATHLRGRKNH